MDKYSKSKINDSLEKIKQILPDKDVYNGSLFQHFFNTTITNDFTRKSLKRIIVKQTHFVDCSFRAVAGTGSKFTESYFKNCNFTGANFQDCYFNKCHFILNTLIKGANFSHSIFIDCTFEGICIKQSTLYDCHFENCIFNACEIYSDTTENSLLYNCKMKQIDLAHINLEYMQIKKMLMQDVKLPPYQIAYIIGAPYYIKNTLDEITVYTDAGDICREEYCNLYEDLVLYYYSQYEYFPLANLMIALDKHEEALKYIKIGIEQACDYFDFRMIKHFCRLACSNDNFSADSLKSIYYMITNLSYNNDWDLNILHTYMLNIGAIRELLLNSSSSTNQRVEILVKTNIEKDDLRSINNLYNQINLLIRNKCSQEHIDSIELRHNSPYEIYITCIDSLPYILALLSSMYAVLTVGNKVLEFIKNIGETQRIWQQNALYKYQKIETELDIELKQLELEEKKKTQSVNSIYTIKEIEHNIKCDTLDIAKNIAPDILHFKYRRD